MAREDLSDPKIGDRIDGAPALPTRVAEVIDAARAAGMCFGVDPRVGALLRILAASKPGGRLLELGTGVGFGAAWLLDGMSSTARLTTIDERDGEIARRCLGSDPRIELLIMDAAEFLRERDPSQSYDLIFADAPPGKLVDLDSALDALSVGGLYVADDMIVDPDDENDRAREPALLEVSRALFARTDLSAIAIPWATGLIVATKRW